MIFEDLEPSKEAPLDQGVDESEGEIRRNDGAHSRKPDLEGADQWSRVDPRFELAVFVVCDDLRQKSDSRFRKAFRLGRALMDPEMGNPTITINGPQLTAVGGSDRAQDLVVAQSRRPRRLAVTPDHCEFG